MDLKNINQPVAQTQGVCSQILVRVVSALLVCLVLYVFGEIFGE